MPYPRHSQSCEPRPVIHARILALLDAVGVRYAVHAHEPARTLEDVQAQVPHLTANLLKTIAFKADQRGRFVLAGAIVEWPWVRCGGGLRTRTLELAPTRSAARHQRETRPNG